VSNKHRLRLIETPSPSRLETCLDMFLLDQEASRHTSRTIGTYRETLTPFLEFLANDNLTKKMIQALERARGWEDRVPRTAGHSWQGWPASLFALQ